MAENICITEFSPEDFTVDNNSGQDSLIIESSPGVFELTEEVSRYSIDGTEKIRTSFSKFYNKKAEEGLSSSISFDFLLPEVFDSAEQYFFGPEVSFGHAVVRSQGVNDGVSFRLGSNIDIGHDLRDGRWYTVRSTREFTGINTLTLLDSEGLVLAEGTYQAGTSSQNSTPRLYAFYSGSIPVKVRNLEFCAETIIDVEADMFQDFYNVHGNGATVFGLYSKIHRDYEEGILDSETISRANKVLTYTYSGAISDQNTAFNIYLGNIDI